MSKEPAVDVYFNLHKHVWSVRKKGRVVDHKETVLLQSCRFVVQPAGHAKVLREKRKNVHAFARGLRREFLAWSTWERLARYEQVECTYNPFKAPFFYEKSTGKEVVGAMFTQLTSDRRVIAWGLFYGPRHLDIDGYQGTGVDVESK
jgi:hypothetical protein